MCCVWLSFSLRSISRGLFGCLCLFGFVLGWYLNLVLLSWGFEGVVWPVASLSILF